MQHKTFITAIAALGLLCACGEKRPAIEFEKPAEVYFTDSILVYPAGSITTDTITGEQLDTDIIGLVNMKAADGLIAVSTSTEPKISLLSDDGGIICSYGRTGQGPDDFLNTEIAAPHISESGDTCAWVNDISACVIKRLNFSASRRRGAAKVDSVIPTEFGAINAFVAGDRLVFETLDNDAYKLYTRSLTDSSDTLHKSQLYVRPTDAFYIYLSNGAVTPDGRYLFLPMAYINQANILDLTTGERKAVSLGNVLPYDRSYNFQERSPKIYAYGASASGADRLYAIYYGTDAESEAEATSTTIHEITADGHIARIIYLPEALVNIAFDSSTGTLYGFDIDDHIYRYRL